MEPPDGLPIAIRNVHGELLLTLGMHRLLLAMVRLFDAGEAI
jgi:hypothetical protein